MINFAHGEIYMIGAYVGLITLTALGVGGNIPVPLLIMTMIVVAAFVTGCYGYTVERVAYRPLRNSARLVSLISAIGMSIFLQNWVALGQGARDVAVPNILPGAFQIPISENFDITITYARLLIIVVVFALMVALTLFNKKSRIGRASRAC